MAIRRTKPSREEFSLAVKRDVRDRAGGLCSQPQCRIPTVGADNSTEQGVTIIGVAAHIRAAAPGGPRHDPIQVPAERTSIKNAIWLCASCATLIDKNQGRNFSVEQLIEWKQKAEQRSAEALLFKGSLSRPDWLDKIHYAQFLNVPRLASMLGNESLIESLDIDPKHGFRGQGMRVAQVSYWLENAICRAAIEALPLEEVLPVSVDLTGQLISFNHLCYTRNGVDAGTTVAPKYLSDFDQKRTPHFYIKAGDTKIVFPYDPAWITTSTAYCDFGSGRTRFAGLGLVKRVSDDLNEMFVSPLIVAFPKTEFMQRMDGQFG